LHFAIKASRNILIKLGMVMKDARSNGDDSEKEINKDIVQQQSTYQFKKQQETRN